MINQSLQNKLREKFNPDGSNLRILQLRMLDMLKFIDNVCKNNNITYWLSSGTCLGAVRHGGFIPWDDDCDIEMLEKDYNKFKAIMSKMLHPQYTLQSEENDEGFVYPFCKIRDKNSILYETHEVDKFYKFRGIYVDVFCMIKCSNLLIYKFANYLKIREYFYKIAFLKNKKIMMKIISTIYKFINAGISPLCLFMLKLNSKNVLRHKFGTGFLKPRNKNEIFPLTYLKFEDSIFPVPGNYDAYLKKLYGEYEKLPEISMINPHMIDYSIIENHNIISHSSY